MFEIIDTLNEKDIKDDFVAIGTLLDKNKEPAHAALIIQYNSNLFEFHYTSTSIELDLIKYPYFHKRTKTIHKAEIPAFIAWCRAIKKNANPIYGYFYNGEYYDKNGNHFSDKITKERMTCVGFCLNVLKGFLEDDYIDFSDWDSSSHSIEYLKKYAEKYNLKIEDIEDSHRRINPLEILTSGFFNKIPITKKQIDTKIEEVKEYLIKY